jgi:hypothetical protein
MKKRLVPRKQNTPSKQCLSCGKTFFKNEPVYDSKRIWVGRKFCSKSCSNRVHSSERIGDKNPRTGVHYKHKPETVKKLSIGKLGSKNPMFGKTGSKHHLWMGGLSNRGYGKEFKTPLKLQIRERDSFTCQECYFTEEQLGYKLSVHHIDYNKKNNDPQNLISLCKSCHLQTNFSREDWQRYFINKFLILNK